MAAWRRFVSCGRSLPADQAGPLRQTALAKAQMATSRSDSLTLNALVDARRSNAACIDQQKKRGRPCWTASGTPNPPFPLSEMVSPQGNPFGEMPCGQGRLDACHAFFPSTVLKRQQPSDRQRGRFLHVLGGAGHEETGNRRYSHHRIDRNVGFCAADMGAPPPAPAPVYNWTGWYAGVNAGASFGNVKTETRSATLWKSGASTSWSVPRAKAA
jgi:hypothetical protein